MSNEKNKNTQIEILGSKLDKALVTSEAISRLQIPIVKNLE